MKKLFFSTVALVFVLSFSACSGFEYSLEETNTEEVPVQEEQIPQISEDPVESVDPQDPQDDFLTDDTKVEEISSDEIFCMEVFQPVCGMIESVCEDDVCEYVPQTFSNSCYAEKANAKNITEGACE